MARFEVHYVDESKNPEIIEANDYGMGGEFINFSKTGNSQAVLIRKSLVNKIVNLDA